MDDLNYRQGCRWLALAIAIVIQTPVPACGPFFPTQILATSDHDMMAVPSADFAVEVERLKPARLPVVKAVLAKSEYGRWNDYDAATYAKETADADVLDVRDALAEAGVPASKASVSIEGLRGFRAATTDYARELGDWEATARYANKSAPRPVFASPDLAWLSNLPPEFALYEQGALAWHNHELEKAAVAWGQILQLPETQRRYRSVWAAYMLGRAASDTNAQEARKYFALCRELASAGFYDRTGLAAASLGWEAKVALSEKQYRPAIELYLQQLNAGDPRAATSLRDCAAEAIKLPPAALVELVKDSTSRQVLVARLLSCGGAYSRGSQRPDGQDKSDAARLVRAIEKAGIKEAAGADRLAWLAYQAGNVDAAERWIKIAAADSAMATYVRAKIALRSGKIDAAAKLLAQAARAFPDNQEWDLDAGSPYETYHPGRWAAGELAILKLRRSQYTEAVDLLLRSGWWTDAAYVAERVLTVDELAIYVDKAWPKKDDAAGRIGSVRDQDSSVNDIRYLLGRRLVRLGRWKDAREYMRPDVLPKLDAYVAAIRAGHDASRKPADRAASLWEAARIARQSGMEIMGTALAPDHIDYGGGFEPRDPSTWRAEQAKKSHINVASADEQARMAKPAAEPMKRYHYRYIAADHAWAAAGLMPDESDQTAGVLTEAGTWIKYTDPKAADRFYKALVRRCGTTALGKQAADLRWFPPMSDEP